MTTFELTPAMTLILLVLSNEAKHGYAIMTDIVSMSNGLHRVGPGTLYRSIGQLLKHGMIHEDEIDSDGDERRKHYRITEHGKRALALELIRLERLLRMSLMRSNENE